jgi:2-dehydro-3-deoxyphosphogluconate aldolase/(4S)-4-hydroxy-2-oxoglutarate aldolase
MERPAHGADPSEPRPGCEYLVLGSPVVDAAGALEIIEQDRILAVIRAARVPDPAGLARALVDAGVRAVEFTLTIPDVLAAIQAATSSGAVVGAGTVVEAGQAQEAIAAGAAFVTGPAFVLEVVEASRSAGVAVFPAAFSPTEVLAAARSGASAIKLFPARAGGPGYVRDLLGPFPELRLIPSGGVGEETAASLLDAGAFAVFAGTSLAPADLVEAGDHEAIGKRARGFVEAISGWRRRAQGRGGAGSELP